MERWRILKKLELEQPHNPETPLLGIYLKEMKTLSQKKKKKYMPPCSLQHIYNSQKGEAIQEYIDIQLDKMWYTHTMDYSSALIKKELLTHVTTWMNLDYITLSEISQSQNEMTHRCIHSQENKHHVNTLAPLYVLSGRGKRRKKAVENSQFFKTCQTARSHNSKACDFLNTTLTSQQNCKPTCRDPEEQEEHTVFPFPPDNYLSIFTTLFFEQAGQKVIA